ncbi:MAG TPA: GAF domain-containing protein, partial [Candidatus Angelobacter sp.]|nr:GAF domain-containing protein [Candidatus Angelobacter sp.]
MKTKPQLRQLRSKPPARSAIAADKILEACAGIAALCIEPDALRNHIAQSTRDLLKAGVANILLRNGNNYVPGPIAASSEDHRGNEALLGHACSFAIKAIEQKKMLDFRFSYRADAGEAIYHGLAAPLITAQSTAVLLVIRKAVFTPSDVAAFHALGNVSQLALNNAELAALHSVQKKEMDDLLEISAELGATSKLEIFLPRFLARGASFLGFSRAFIALVEGDQCHLRWGLKNGITNSLDIDVTAVGSRALESRTPQVCEDLNQLSSPEKAQLLRWEPGLKQYLGVPLITGDGRPLGLLGLFDKKTNTRITPDDVRRARVLGAELIVALEAAHNLALSGQHKKRTEDLMEMALDLGSALRLPDFVKNFTERVAGMIGAKSAILALAQGNKVESVG